MKNRTGLIESVRFFIYLEYKSDIVMKRLFSIFLLICVFTLIAAAQKDIRPKVVCGPYVQCVTDTGFTVIWVTDMDAISWVETAPDDGTHFYNCERPKHYDMRGNGIHVIGKLHKVRVEGLEKGSVCRYRIMSKGVASFNGSGNVQYTRTGGTDIWRGEPHVIKTLSDNYDQIRFDVYNDIHGKDSIMGVLLDGARKDIDFVAFNGDMTSNIESHEMVQTMYLSTAAKKLNGGTPLFASRGNHELRGREAVKWFDYFSTPTDKTYYSYRFGKFFFIVLDACEDKPDSDIEYSGTVISEPYMKAQEAWLKDVLASEEYLASEVRIVFCHIPPELKGWYGNTNVCNYLVPHLNKAGIDAMFCGHIHKFRYDKVGCGISNAEFPVVCFPNAHRTEVTATAKNISLDIFNSDGQKTQSLVLDVK